MNSNYSSPVQTSDGLSTSSSVTPTDTNSELQGSALYQGNLINLIRNSVRCETSNEKVAHQLQEKRQQLSELRNKRQRTNSKGDAMEMGISSTSSDSTDIDHFDDFDSEEEATIFHKTTETISNSTGGDGDKNFSDCKKLDIRDIRKERNRMHAKLTRNRRKLFTNKVVQMIADLEQKNAAMKDRICIMEERRRKEKEATPSLSLPPAALNVLSFSSSIPNTRTSSSATLF